MGAVRIGFSALGLAFAALIVWAAQTGNFRIEGAWLISNPWGIVSLADLYLGFLISAAIIALSEKPKTALLWIAPLPFLGNVWTVAWLVWRLPALRRRLAGAAENSLE
jgi:hypothetical protein